MIDPEALLTYLEKRVDDHGATCKNFGIRIGNLESFDAVQKEQITDLKIDVQKIFDKIDGLAWRVYIIVGVGIAVSALLPKLL